MIHPLHLARWGWLVLCISLLAGCDSRSAGNSADDLQQWQGTWKMTATTYEGAPQSADMAWVVKGNQYFIRMNGQLGVDPYMFKLDADKKQIDVFHHDTPPGTFGGSWKGIYKIDGDTLTVCYDLAGLHYPDAFAASAGSRQVLYEFRRE
ncbi:MAG TPA: TIGR03067 domain-containing protein [Rhizomicrobium sp.]|jgi:uncharacterized protein (TIGR03067 family)